MANEYLLFLFRFILLLCFCYRTFISDVLSKTKYKTKFMRNTTEPVWEEEFLLKGVTHQTLRNTTMQMSVWNYEKGSKHILLGGIRLGVGEVQGDLHDSFGEEFNVWKRFLDYPNESLDFSVPLRSTLESVKRWDLSVFYWTIARN